MHKEVENLDDHGCLKVQELVVSNEEVWICFSYPFPQKTTLHCADVKAKKFGNWTMQHSKLWILF